MLLEGRRMLCCWSGGKDNKINNDTREKKSEDVRME